MSNRRLASGIKLLIGVAHPVILVLALFMIIGCEGTTDIERLRQEMYNQSRFEPLEKNSFFADNRSSRPWIKGTVARGHLRIDAHLYTGIVDGKPAETFPFPITRDVILRGRERYNIYWLPIAMAMKVMGAGWWVRRGHEATPIIPY